MAGVVDTGWNVTLELPEIVALIQLIEHVGVADDRLHSAYHKMLRRRNGIIDAEVKRHRRRFDTKF
jgi:hypothetical protein